MVTGLLLALAAACSQIAGEPMGEARAASREEPFRAAAASLRTAILAKDTGRIMALVDPQGLNCGDSTLSRATVRAALKDRRSRLYIALFDTPALRASHQVYPPEVLAIRDFLARDDVGEPTVVFDYEWEPDKYASVVFHSSGSSQKVTFAFRMTRKGVRLWEDPECWLGG